MKQKLMAYGISLLFLFLSILLCSAILSALYYYHVLTRPIYEGITLAVSIVLFLFAGFLLGKKVQKKALLHALLFIVPMLFISLLATDFSWQALLVIAAKTLCYGLGTIIGVNLHGRIK